MNNRHSRWFSIVSVSVAALAPALTCQFASPTHAQIIPDGTLSTNVTSFDNQNFVIENGDRAGNNLFHSFSDFSVPTNGSASFNNDIDIETIFSRITSTNASNIDGLIQANGSASLLLLNPNGILFGPNARLDIGGSFLSSTANTLLFDDGLTFRATEPGMSRLLSVSVPTGLQWNQTRPNSITFQNATLEGARGANLTFLGGDLFLRDSTLTTLDGQLTLGGLSTLGTVQLDEMQSVSFPNGIPRSDVTLSNASVISTETGGIGVISNTLKLLSGSGLETVTDSPSNAENITLNVDKTIELTESQISSATLGAGDAGHIFIETSQLKLTGSEITMNTSATGDAGDIHIRAQELVELDTDLEPLSVIKNSVASGASGAGGEIEIETSRLRLLNGSQVLTVSNGGGQIGDINIAASESIDVVGGVFDVLLGFAASGIFVSSSSDSDSTTANGNVTITTGQLQVLDGAQITVSTFGSSDGGTLIITAQESIDILGQGPPEVPLSSGLSAASISGDLSAGGDIILRTEQLRIMDGGIISAIAFGAGNGGRVIIDATSINLNTGSILAAAFGSGNAGGIDIMATRNVSVVDEAMISVSGERGNAGELEISASTVLLDQRGELSADTDGGNEGNIRLTVNGSLLLRRGGNITTNATGTSTGGNIDIDAAFVVAVPTENSDIIANAVEGNGGSIEITATGIFGIDFRSELTTWSDITASSEFGIDGIVNIETLDLEPSQDIVKLPSALNDSSNQITTGCSAATGNSFIVSGRGGFPEAPDTLNNSAIWEDWRALETEAESGAASIAGLDGPPTEATGIIIDENDQVEFVVSTTRQPSATMKLASCGSRVNPYGG